MVTSTNYNTGVFRFEANVGITSYGIAIPLVLAAHTQTAKGTMYVFVINVYLFHHTIHWYCMYETCVMFANVGT